MMLSGVSVHNEAYAAPEFCAAPNLGELFDYVGTDSLKINKNRIVTACRDMACTEEQTRIFLAIAMQESNDCCAAQRDCSKDGTPSANYSCFNMNSDFLGLLGYNHAIVDLNIDDNVIHAIAYLIAATHEWGIDKTLAFHRGGRTAFDDMTSYGAQEYIAKIKAVAQYLAEHPERMTDQNRVGYNTPHV